MSRVHPADRETREWHCPGVHVGPGTGEGEMQSFRPLQRWQGPWCRADHDRRGQINWLETLRYKHWFRTRFRVSCLHSLSLLYLDNERYADPLSWLAAATTGLNLSLCGLGPGDNAQVRDTDQWAPLTLLSGEVTGPRPGITVLKWSVITTNFTLLRPVPAPAMTDQFYQLFFNPITSPILFTVSMYNNCLEWHLECSNKTGCVRVTRQRLGETQRMCSNLRLEFPW